MAQNYPTIPGSGNPNMTTPGSAVADTLQAILADKRAEARQIMLDELNRRNTESEMTARQEQADTNKMYREAYKAQRDQNIATSKATQDRLRAVSTWAAAQNPDNDEELKTAFQFIQQDPERGEQLLQAILARKLSNDAKSKKNMVPGYYFDPKTQSLKPLMKDLPAPLVGQEPYMVTEGSQPHFETMSGMTGPQGPQPQPFLVPEPDPNNPGKFIQVAHWFGGQFGYTPNDKNRMFPTPVPIVGPRDPNAPPPVTPPQDLHRVTGIANTKVPGFYDTAALEAYQSALKSAGPNAAAARASTRSVLVNSIKDPSVRMDLQQILSHPEGRKKTADELVAAGVLSGTPDHIAMVKEILDAIPLNNRE